MLPDLNRDLICNIAEFLDPVEISSFRLTNLVFNKRIISHWNKILPIYDILPLSFGNAVPNSAAETPVQSSSASFPDHDKFDLTLENIFKAKNWNSAMSRIALSVHQTLAPELERILEVSINNEFKSLDQYFLPNKAAWIAYCLDPVYPGLVDHAQLPRLYIRGAIQVVFCPCVFRQPTFALNWNSNSDELKPFRKFFLWPYLQKVLFIPSTGCATSNMVDYPQISRCLSNIISPKIQSVNIRAIRCFNVTPSVNSWRYNAEGKRNQFEPVLWMTNLCFEGRGRLRENLNNVFQGSNEPDMAPPSSYTLLNFRGIEKSEIDHLRISGYEFNNENSIHLCRQAIASDWACLTYLDLSHNSLSTSGFITLMKTNSFVSLKLLDVSYNLISCSAAQAEISEAMETKEFMNMTADRSASWVKTLKQLDVSQNSFGNSGLTFLITCFQGLERLNCSQNLITDNGLSDVFQHKSSGLLEINLSVNVISSVGLDNLAKFMNGRINESKWTLILKKSLISEAEKQTWIDVFDQFRIQIEF